jgi:hypothetical protein
MCPVSYNLSILIVMSYYVDLNSIATVEKLKIINCICCIYSIFKKKILFIVLLTSNIISLLLGGIKQHDFEIM